MKKINIAELLKNCPKGMELDCTICNGVKFIELDKNPNYPIVVRANNGYEFSLTKYGQVHNIEDAKCVIYPKEKTTWEGFVPPYKFKDGDILFAKSVYDWIFIYKESGNDVDLYKYVSIPHNCSYKFITYDDNPICRKKEVSEIRLATEEEKKKLFDAIKAKGYKWNEETKTLEKLEQTWTIQYAKDGDVLAFDDETIVIFKDLYNNTSFHSYCHIEDGIFTISKEDMPDWWRTKGFYPATEEQCTLLFRKIKEAGYHWNAETKTLEKLINKNKFVIGAIVTNGKIKGRICLRDGDSYVLEDGTPVFFNEVHNWELVPNKFDITTLKPFDRVLVRDNNTQRWTADLFSFYDKSLVYPYSCIGHYTNQCVPFESNKHLLGTTDDCDEYFKNWEE